MSRQSAEVLAISPIGTNLEGPLETPRHDFGAEAMICLAAQTVKEARRISDLSRAEKIMTNAGILAAREAMSYGYEIKGWEGELARLPRLTTDQAVEDETGGMYVNYDLSNLQELPDRYQVLANLADSYELRRIRQTGSQLIPAGREIRFALTRIEEARQLLVKEEEALAKLQAQA